VKFKKLGFSAPLRTTSLYREARLYGAACFVVALFGIAHFVAGPFWSGPFFVRISQK